MPQACGPPPRFAADDSIAFAQKERRQPSATYASEVPGFDADVPAEIRGNGAGAFEVAGPEGDNGLSGRKLVMDAYGPRVPIGPARSTRAASPASW